MAEQGSEVLRVVLAPELGFAALSDHLAADGTWSRIPTLGAGSPIVPGEPELAQWEQRHDGTSLTYTFNPAAGLRVVELEGPSAGHNRRALERELPCHGTREIAAALGSEEPAEVLRGILAARALDAIELVGPLQALLRHGDPAIAEAAERTHLELLHRAANELAGGHLRGDVRSVLDGIATHAMPLLAALPGASPDELLGLRPTPEDCEAIFVPEIAGAVHGAYEAFYTPSLRVRPARDQRQLDVWACPALAFVIGGPLAAAFPGGYRALAPYLLPGSVWLAWRYRKPHQHSGLAFDGLVHVGGDWVWFPKPYRVVAGLVAGA